MLSPYINTLFVDAGLLNLVIAIGFAFFGYRFWGDWRSQPSNVDRALSRFFVALTIDRMWSVVQKGLNACCEVGYPLAMLLARNIILVIVIAAFIHLIWTVGSDNAEL